MNDVILLALIVSTTLLAIYLWAFKAKKENTGKPIPGPPLIEGLRTFLKGSLNNTLHIYLPKWAEKYGDVMQVDLFVKKIVIFNNADIFKRLMKEGEFRDITNDRPPTFFAKYVNCGDNDIACAQFGPALQSRRRVFHNILKFYGEGRGQFEELMVTTLLDLIEKMRQKETFDLSVSIQNYILGLIGFLLSGDISENAQKNLEKLQVFSEVGDSIFCFEIDTMLQTFPSLRLIPGLRYKKLYDSVMFAKQKVHDTYFYAMKKTFDPERKRGMVDEMISIQQEKDTKTVLDDETIKGLIRNVVAAAYLTSSSTISILFLHLIKYQNIQDLVYDEIKRVIGSSTPSFKHKQQMPYTEAAIMETLRISSNVPLLLPHYTRDDITFDGYFIPKSTTLFMNAWHNHHREDFWKDPWTFRPERFLDASGQLLDSEHPNRQRLIPFGTGRRACPGETFGKSRAFLIVAFLLQSFHFLPAKGETLPSLNPETWSGKTVLCPKHYKCRVKLRNE